MTVPPGIHRHRHRLRGGGTRAFTLIEVLVSMAILSLIVVLVAQLVNSTSATSKLQTQRLDADSQARVIFDRMAIDFAGMVRRPDMDCSAYDYPNFAGRGGFKKSGNDGLLFFSQALSMGVSADQPQDTISVVGYRIYDSGGDSENAFQLDRAGQGANWAAAGANGNPGIPFLSFLNPITFKADGTIDLSKTYAVDENKTIARYWAEDFGSFNTPGSMSPHSANSRFHTLSRDVFRLEFALLLKDGAFLKTDSLDFAKDEQRAFRDVQAVVVTIAILDSASRARLGNDPASALRSVATKLADDYTADAARNWTAALQSGVPPVVTANARVYQRYFYLK